MATHSSVLAWRIPGTGEPGGLPSMGSHRVGHDGSDLAAAAVVRLFATPWTGVCQASLSMEFSRQEYWNGLPCPSPGDLSYPGIEPGSPALQACSLLYEPPGMFISTMYKIESFVITLKI